MARPTTISITPTTCIRDVGLNGSILCASGLTYCSQLVSRLRNLSSPARNAINPRATLEIVCMVCSLSRIACITSYPIERECPAQVTSANWLLSHQIFTHQIFTHQTFTHQNQSRTLSIGAKFICLCVASGLYFLHRSSQKALELCRKCANHSGKEIYA